MKYSSFTESNAITNEVQVNFHVFCPLMLNRVGGEVGGADVVAVDNCCSCDRLM
jgi:hypothetical protein